MDTLRSVMAAVRTIPARGRTRSAHIPATVIGTVVTDATVVIASTTARICDRPARRNCRLLVKRIYSKEQYK